MMAKLLVDYPDLSHVLINERDIYLTHSLQMAAEKQVFVVGKGKLLYTYKHKKLTVNYNIKKITYLLSVLLNVYGKLFMCRWVNKDILFFIIL